ncbi:MAG: acyl-ACP--UDP-N-acetylglucosamine O-acyltransferase [Candidatus Omnitrophica bacterium]|nr:acyl-ACP--UDP-N-acetylglucosamine O-acyltransferase [Candidatus Omnitrophota bacterium]MDD5488063.1 acyl-ACP--UDP-N-acetylglucosamine O-acyltransferase [Candidatus Omnitrophota bacterium]
MKAHGTAMISRDAEIADTVEIGPGVIIEAGVKIASGVRIMANAYICGGTEIGENTVIYTGAVIGNDPQDHAYKGGPTFTRIGKNNVIREYVTIHRGTAEGSATVVGDDNMLMVQSHLGHNCEIEDNVIIANGALLAGHVKVEKGAFISGNVVFHQFCRVGRYAMIGGFTGVNKDVPPYLLVRGPSVIRGINLVGLRRAGFTADVIREVKEAYKAMFLSGLSVDDALARIKSGSHSPEIEHFVSFVETSKRKICKVRFSKEEFF